VGHMSRSSSFLRMETSLARVSQPGLKTGRGTTTGDARGTIAEVASEASEDGRVNETGCVRPCYPTFPVFNVLGLRGIVVI
jgi:hypothetical protein